MQKLKIKRKRKIKGKICNNKNIYTIKVTRSDGYYIEDLDKLLNDDNINDINVNINVDSVISTEVIEKIKNSKKIVKLNYFDENKKLIYSWTIDGKTNRFLRIK